MESTAAGPVAQSIQSKIKTGAEPDHLEIINESYMHNVPKGSETHFKVVVVSKTFDGMSLIKV
jgi:stress-induced morphogen